KQKYLPRVAGGEISAFALTERHAGSDPATMSLRAEPTPDGSEFILNGEKLWCTNGVKAGVLVVRARTPAEVVGGREGKRINAFNGAYRSANMPPLPGRLQRWRATFLPWRR